MSLPMETSAAGLNLISEINFSDREGLFLACTSQNMAVDVESRKRNRNRILQTTIQVPSLVYLSVIASRWKRPIRTIYHQTTTGVNFCSY